MVTMNRSAVVTAVTFAATVAVAMCGRSKGFNLLEAHVRHRREAADTAAGSGYIYRTDGQNPPVFIKLGEGNDQKFNDMLESFKRENGFHGAPEYMPAVGQEDRYAPGGDGYGSRGYGKPFAQMHDRPDDDLGFKFEMGDMDDIADFVDGLDYDYSKEQDYERSSGGTSYGIGPDSAPHKYHHDVSGNGGGGGGGGGAGGLKGDLGHEGLEDQGYYGSPYTHNEYKSPGKHSKSGGSYQKAGHYFSEGNHGDSGFKSHRDYDKGHAGKYGHDDVKGHFNKAAGHSAGHSDVADHYGKHHSGTHGVVGHKFGETETHKMGQKTTGFHNVYHKDEYNKEQNFYEDAHKHGKHDKYGGKHKDFVHRDGGQKKGGHHQAGYDEAHKGVSGTFNKGGYHDGHRGHSGESGHKSHQDHKAEYDTASDNKKYGENYGGGDDFY